MCVTLANNIDSLRGGRLLLSSAVAAVVVVVSRYSRETTRANLDLWEERRMEGGLVVETRRSGGGTW